MPWVCAQCSALPTCRRTSGVCSGDRRVRSCSRAVQVATAQEFHDQKRRAAILPKLAHLHDVGVKELGDGRRLGDEAAVQLILAIDQAMQDFDGAGLSQLAIRRAVHRSIAPCPAPLPTDSARLRPGPRPRIALTYGTSGVLPLQRPGQALLRRQRAAVPVCPAHGQGWARPRCLRRSQASRPAVARGDFAGRAGCLRQNISMHISRLQLALTLTATLGFILASAALISWTPSRAWPKSPRSRTPPSRSATRQIEASKGAAGKSITGKLEKRSTRDFSTKRARISAASRATAMR